ncbi:hypothetical protein NECAME_03923 [Necator americanus]|uniref:Uncharacterized protein n=1 Tax=Necator americanus TaxID=51031 RepID=W2SYR0_NECAM|nr:hypothetical protein NECAME_03923 [Necator americanus]ETN74790.1 hypothetical protein NECAME_03923 [Necator americanus]
MASSSSNQVDEGDHDSAPGPLGCKYDDSLTELRIHLVIPGIREKTIMKASNTQESQLPRRNNQSQQKGEAAFKNYRR